MKLLLAAQSFRPETGGPARSVSRLGAELASCGLSVTLWAPDGSAETSPVVAEARAAAAGAILHTASLDPARLLDDIRPDILHDNGIWQLHHHKLAKACAGTNTPRVVSPRGMLEPWALSHKRVRKQFALWAYQKHDLQRAAMLHATSEPERQQLMHLGLTAPIVVAPNGIDMPDHEDRQFAAPQERTVLFLSRIHPKKGLPMLIRAFAAVAREGARLRIAGMDENGHEAEMRALAASTGAGDRIEFLGPLFSAEKEHAYRKADIFVLPTHSENFGIVVAEALSFGLPVITTTGAPWREIAKSGCGWWVDPKPQAIESALSEALAAPSARLAAMGAKGRLLAEQRFGWRQIALRFVDAYGPLREGFVTTVSKAARIF